MALKAVRYWRSVVENENVNRSLMRSFVSSTTPKSANASTVINDDASKQIQKKVAGGAKGFLQKNCTPELCPLLGIMLVALGIGIHTAYKNLRHHPDIKITKFNRATSQEADNPDQVAKSGNKYINTSFLRKVGHIQDRSST